MHRIATAIFCDAHRTAKTSVFFGRAPSIAQEGVRAIDARNSQLEMAQMLQIPVFALPGCQRMSVNTLLCDTLGLAEFWGAFEALNSRVHIVGCKNTSRRNLASPDLTNLALDL